MRPETMPLDRLEHLEKVIDVNNQRAEERHAALLARLDDLVRQLSQLDRHVAVLEEKLHSSAAMADRNDGRITQLENTKHFVSGMYAVLAAVASWLFSHWSSK